MQLIDGQPVYAATDLVGFLACSHRLALERAALGGLVKKPIRADPAMDLIAKRGTAHEQRYRDELIASGRTVVEITPDGSIADRGDVLRAAAAATIDALKRGVDIVYQATFFDGRWVGYADFLLKMDTPSDLGPWSYEVADTKLARSIKGSAVLQICSYVEQLTAIQGVQPELLHVVLGGSKRETASLRVADYMAYYRRVKAEFEAAVSAGEPVYPVTATYPDPVEHCDICKWVVDCKAQRRRDDDLSLVAGITARQRRALKDRAIRHRRELAVLELPMDPRLEGVSGQALERVREQARIQVQGEDAREPRWELLAPELDDDGALVADRGFTVLPEPTPHDLFFDIEGDPFALEDGVEYLFGVLEPGVGDPARPGEPMFHEIWSRASDGTVTRAAEKAAFEQLVDLLTASLDADPAMHVYHYAAYEKSALTRLAQRHGTREEAVDRLLRGRVLVDLFRVVRQGIRASVESYSIKRLEPLYGLVREVELQSAGSSIVAFEAWLEGGRSETGEMGEDILRAIAGYNRDDVVSNLKLRDFLEDRRRDLETKLGMPVPRPPLQPEAEAPKQLTEKELRTADLVARLTSGAAAERSEQTDDEHARWLLGQLLDWHRREDKAFWWRFFDLAGKTDEELVDEREPLGRLEFIDDLGAMNRAGSVLQRFRFPLQDHGLKEGTQVVNPESVADHGPDGCGSVHAIDELELVVTLKRSKKDLQMGDRPKALIPFDYFQTGVMRDSLARTAEWVLQHGLEAPGIRRAALDLLARRPPRTRERESSLQRTGETPLQAAVRLGLALDGGTLAIQGPPGSGKTYTAARMIVALVREGRRVGITANSHKVIGHALDKVREAAVEAGVVVGIGQKPAADEPPTCADARPLGTTAAVKAALLTKEVDVVGGTAWLWSSAEMEGSVDVLFVDEAGQFSLANAIAVAPAGGSLVLLGDPQQLDQPLQGSHPPGAERSALGHVLDGEAVIRADLGLFLADTWRLHPDVCDFTSEVFYEDRLESEPSLSEQALVGVAPADGTGVRWLPVQHDGNATESIDEAAVIAGLVRELLDAGATWTDRKGVTKPVELRDILIVAPYNAHVERIRRTLAAVGLLTDRVGTVDKFQGQEAPISIYSMATSTPEEAPRGMEFLYSLHRLNVATSRARCAAIVVASPALIRVACHTPRQMQLANALCRLVEVAQGDTDGGIGHVPPNRPPGPIPSPGPVSNPLAGGGSAAEQLSWLEGDR
ncbi:MAG TPA: TM0106 family RecB-like putative nuclease [Candidatus Limnocylindria bacterium]|nr:TM0106 family RecB-like putative nuclease [Candidatus Limnocylindria bacterium]